jgi:hypothetical protein
VDIKEVTTTIKKHHTQSKADARNIYDHSVARDKSIALTLIEWRHKVGGITVSNSPRNAGSNQAHSESLNVLPYTSPNLAPKSVREPIDLESNRSTTFEIERRRRVILALLERAIELGRAANLDTTKSLETTEVAEPCEKELSTASEKEEENDKTGW